MPRRKKLTPRKSPRQTRSAATVDAIVEAAAYILKREGWSRLTTNRIAERAGVNIASLYQYFPNKEAIAHELHRRFRAQIHATVTPERVSAMNQDLRALVRSGVDGLLCEVAKNPEMHRVFLDELPPSTRHVDRLSPEVTAAFDKRVKPQMRGVPDPDLALWMWNKVLDGLVRAACAERPELLVDARFASEMCVLLDRFLLR
jgi:AcrR family transcriptional regulator